MPNKRQTFFSQYRGRGGPAIEPGTLKMMGEIGEEYGRGIREFGEAIGEGLKRRDEEEKIRNENETWKEILLGGTTPDTEGWKEAVEEEKAEQIKAGERVELAKRESELASAKAGQYNPLKHTNEIQKELDKYKTKNDSSLEVASSIHSIIDTYKADLDQVELDKQAFIESASGFGDFTGESTLNALRNFEKRTQKINSDFIAGTPFETPLERMTHYTNRLREIQKRTDVLSPYVAKLEQYKNMEIRNPGATAGFNKIKRGVSGELEVEDTEKGKLVDKRIELFQTIRQNIPDESFVGVPVPSVNIREAVGTLPPEALKATFGVKPEELNRLLTFGKQPLSRDAADKLAAYQTAQESFTSILSRPTPSPDDYIREKTQTEILQDVVKNDDNRKYRAGFLQSVAAYAQKVREPSINLQEFGGHTYAVYKPGQTAVQRIPKPGEMTISNQISMLRYNRSLGNDITSGLNKLRDTHKADVSRLDDAIYKLESAKASGIIQGTGMPWNEVDDKRLEVLKKERADIDRQFTAGMQELGQGMGGTSVSPQEVDIVVK